MFSFGSGVLIGTRNDIANGTPINFGLVQEVTIDESATIKELFGQFQRPVAIARGTIKTTGKAKVAKISGIALASLFYGFVPQAGQVATIFGEASSIPATPYQVTVANAATFIADQGVIYALTGLPLTQVAAVPTTGQYSVNQATGVYTFAAADTLLGVLISYNYGVTGTGQKVLVSNQLLGTTPTFSINFFSTFQGKNITVKYNQCTSNKLGLSTKLEDFTMPEFDFSCFADQSNNVATWSFSEAS